MFDIIKIMKGSFSSCEHSVRRSYCFPVMFDVR